MQRFRTAIPLIIVILGLAPVAHTVGIPELFIDNFNDNSIDNDWRRTVDVIRVQERERRLKFRSSLPGSGERFSGYRARGWKVDYTQDYTVSFRYRVNVNGVTGNRYAGVGVRLVTSGTLDEVRIEIRQDRNRLRLVVDPFQNGHRIEGRARAITTTRGKVTIQYRQAQDRIDIFVDDVRVIRINAALEDLNTGNNLARIDIGANRKGPVTWNWNHVWMDSFRVSGEIVD